MGEGITIKCKQCDYQETYILGIGMMYSSLENVISLISPYRRETVLNILHTQYIHEVKYEYKLFICLKCNSIIGRFDYSIIYGDGQIYRPYFRCPECKTKLITVTEPISNIRCPSCGEKSLVENFEMLWD